MFSRLLRGVSSPLTVAGYRAWIMLGFLCPMHVVRPSRTCESGLSFDAMI
ncbi:hypothetical protein QBC45DRAFT_315521 [Copromyces sp. CBS 386.78]|nr:hypothetical protein QBC45DRAFT_315521 [Copromyces sp. CBS 386.78]